MREIILNQINTALHEHQGFYHSEKEIQIYLAEYFRRTSSKGSQALRHTCPQ